MPSLGRNFAPPTVRVGGPLDELLPVHIRLKLERLSEVANYSIKCLHDWHSIQGLPFRWECCHCHSYGTQTIFDYYVYSNNIGRDAPRTAI